LIHDIVLMMSSVSMIIFNGFHLKALFIQSFGEITGIVKIELARDQELMVTLGIIQTLYGSMRFSKLSIRHWDFYYQIKIFSVSDFFL